MKSKELNEFKEVLKEGMIANFKKDGFLTPILFFYMENKPMIIPVPSELFSCSESKQILARIIQNFCQENPVLAAGIIIEANGVKMDGDSEMSKLVMNGDIKVSELKEKQDIIFMLFSTPENDDLISYVVDCKNKTIGEPFSVNEITNACGVFSGFFSWNKN
jgi:hypothetical protein